MRKLLPLFWIFLCLGCAGPGLPAITEVEGTVLLDDQPLPHALGQFVPELQNFGAEYISTAMTDAEGKFKLICYKDRMEGAVVGKHSVVIIDSTPAELRGYDAESRAKFAEYYAELKNRPIPDIYASVAKTPLHLEVTADHKTYTLQLRRSQ